MATIFLDPGGDATLDVPSGLWPNKVGSPSLATDFVHGGHLRSIKYAVNSSNYVLGSNFATDAGGRNSHWVYFNVLPAATNDILRLEQASDGNTVVQIQITHAGVTQLAKSGGTQVGSNGPTLATGKWYRIALCWKITSTTVNELRLFVFDSDGVTSLGSISVTNTTLTNVTSADIEIGNGNADSALDMRTSDHYIDNSNALTDPGNIWVTAKRPNANGTTNGFTTQIGSGGSGYGTGHSPQVNERPVSTTNGWSMVGAGSAVTEEYNIEGAATGDIDISTATIVDYMGWVYAKSLSSETGKIIVSNVQTNISLTSTATIFEKIAGSATYPAGTGTDIGIVTSTTLTTVSLYEAGIVVAYIPAATTTTHLLSLLGVGS